MAMISVFCNADTQNIQIFKQTQEKSTIFAL